MAGQWKPRALSKKQLSISKAKLKRQFQEIPKNTKKKIKENKEEK